MCCGQKRTELSNSQSQSVARSVPRTFSGNRPAPAVRTQPSAPPPPPAVFTHQPAYILGQRIPPQTVPRASTQQHSIRMRYVETSPIRVRGLVSGTSYEFSGTAPIQEVDVRDAASLLNTRFFRHA
jgi:hypothetical protein